MNLSFMQSLQEQQAQGENLGANSALLEDSPGSRLSSGLSIDTEASGASPAQQVVQQIAQVQQTDTSTTGLEAQSGELTLGATVANEVMRRLEESEGTEFNSEDSDDLRNSFGQALDWVRQRFGDDAAAAASGMVLDATASGVDEESLGNGLLDTLQFIDRNFGFTAGDEAIEQFNSGVNADINDYFDNGLNEVFHASTTSVDGTESQDVSTRFFLRTDDVAATGEDAVNMTEQLLESLKGELDEVAELQDLTSQLEAEFAPTQAQTQAAIAAYESVPMDTTPQFTSTMI